MIEVFKITHDIYDKDTTKFLKLREHNTERAHRSSHRTQSTTISTKVTKSYKKEVLQSVVGLCNSLPRYVVESNNINTFKNKANITAWKHELRKFEIRSDHRGPRSEFPIVSYCCIV